MTTEFFLTKKEINDILFNRKKNTCKNDYGHIFVLAGSQGMTGAAVLTAQAAMRAGAGLVTLGIAKSLNQIVATKLTEVMTLPLLQTNDGNLDENAYDEIIGFIKRRKVSVLIIGPGLSTAKQTTRLVKKIIRNIELPCVLDADGINALKKDTYLTKEKWKVSELKNAKLKIIMTPHPGELGRLINKTSDDIQQDRIKYAENFAKENGIIIILKGSMTIVSDGIKNFINNTGNPGMATAGCGDVLAGIIGGLIAQMPKSKGLYNDDQNKTEHERLLKVSKLAVYLHGLAGDLSAQDKTEAGLIATDVLEKNIPEAIKKLKNDKKYEIRDGKAVKSQFCFVFIRVNS